MFSEMELPDFQNLDNHIYQRELVRQLDKAVKVTSAMVGVQYAPGKCNFLLLSSALHVQGQLRKDMEIWGLII